MLINAEAASSRKSGCPGKASVIWSILIKISTGRHFFVHFSNIPMSYDLFRGSLACNAFVRTATQPFEQEFISSLILPKLYAWKLLKLLEASYSCSKIKIDFNKGVFFLKMGTSKMPTVRNILFYGCKLADTLPVETVSDLYAKYVIVLRLCVPTNRRTRVITSVVRLMKGRFE